ncbi:unnamed protein product [Hymenolepis diminuta]|uniref:Uncharacterized protein n=1 Tax=Hymenolepis diminuta TaxID=6216 RepID=A0A564YBJ4_HYMDI|nr:unnamed protein product [Hymenolepis diminuta]
MQLIISQRKEIVVEIINSLQFRNRTTLHAGVQICMRCRKNLLSRYTALTSKPKTEPTEIYLNIVSLRNPETPKTQFNHQSDLYSGHFRRHPMFKHMDGEVFKKS